MKKPAAASFGSGLTAREDYNSLTSAGLYNGLMFAAAVR